MPNNESVGLLPPLWEPQNSAAATVDIVFIHGLGGDRNNTWTYTSNEGPSHFWPKEFLPEKCPTARILTFGYNAQFIEFYYSKKQVPIGTNIDTHSTSLLSELANLRSATKSTTRPIIFVAHSLGGIVCANALSRAPTDEATKLIVKHTWATVFLGTPFEGSPKALPGQTILRMAKWLGARTNTKDVEELSKESEKVNDIRSAFLKFLRERNEAQNSIHVICYFETSESYVEEKKKWVSVGVVVEKHSAALPGYDPVPIEANHKSMCKFASKRDPGFQTVSGLLARLVEDLDKEGQPKEQNRGPSATGDVNHHGNNYGGMQFGHLVSDKERGIDITGPSHQSFNFGDPKPPTNPGA